MDYGVTEGTYDANDNIIKVYTPTDLTDPEVKTEYTFQLVHEFVHAVIQQINPVVGQIKWLDEGTAYYAALQLDAALKEGPPPIHFPTKEQLETPEYFDDFGGSAYFYSGMIVKYLVDTYGIATFNEMIRDPLQLERILETTTDQLYEDWRASTESSISSQ